jgi:hypothetical protein
VCGSLLAGVPAFAFVRPLEVVWPGMDTAPPGAVVRGRLFRFTNVSLMPAPPRFCRRLTAKQGAKSGEVKVASAPANDAKIGSAPPEDASTLSVAASFIWSLFNN